MVWNSHLLKNFPQLIVIHTVKGFGIVNKAEIDILHTDKTKWIKDLNVGPETIKLSQENICRTLDYINQSKIFYDPPPRVMEIKTKINKWDPIKLKSFCTAKETTNKVKRQPSEWEKIIACPTSFN